MNKDYNNLHIHILKKELFTINKSLKNLDISKEESINVDKISLVQKNSLILIEIIIYLKIKIRKKIILLILFFIV